MKTLEQINEAREKIGNRIRTNEDNLDLTQLALLAGMINALVWVAGGADCTTIQRVLNGEPLAVRKHNNDDTNSGKPST